jgi:hypothetical protein
METPLEKPSRLKRILRRILFVLAALVTLAALALAEENWRGARAWQNYKRDMEAKGERFDIARLIPAKVPDDQNFAKTPYLAPLLYLPPEVLRQPVTYVTKIINGEEVEQAVGLVQSGTKNLGSYFPDYGNLQHRPSTWPYATAADLIVIAKACEGTNSDGTQAEIADATQAASIILDHLQPCEPTLAELRAASSRPYSQFNIPWEEWPNPQLTSAFTEHVGLLKGLLQILSLHAIAEMVLGRNSQALEDINVMFRVDDALKEEPMIISQLVRFAGTAILLQPVGQGLAEQRWSEDQLRILQERLQKTDLIASTVRAFYGERDIYFNPSFNPGFYPSFNQGYMLPRGWNYLEQIDGNRTFQESMLARIDLAAREINPSVNHSIDLAFQKSHPGPVFDTVLQNLTALLHHKVMATMMAPALFRVPQNLAFAQSEVDMAMVVCALERYRLAQGQYPDNLNALVPRFVAVLPHDIINGQPLKYRRTANGRFILYSVGWNEKDDGGVVATNKANPPRQDPLQGDWVWQYPASP